MARERGELIVKASEAASGLFNALFNEALSGKDPEVVVTWVDGGTGAQGKPTEVPRATIGGMDAAHYVKRLMGFVTVDEELIAETGRQFENTVGLLWESTAEELQELDLALEGLSTSREAGYFARAEKMAEEQGTIGIGDGELITTARQLASADVRAWADAVEAARAREL